MLFAVFVKYFIFKWNTEK